MGLSAFKLYQELLKVAHYNPTKMGFAPGCKAGDINEFANRVRLARSFRGLNLEGYKEETVAGYNGFLQVFLTHSAFERHLEINGIEICDVRDLLTEDAKKIIAEFVEVDSKKRLYEFLYSKLSNKNLKTKLEELYTGTETNIAYLSASIRHIFVHGYLTAHANRNSPSKTYLLCNRLSDYLIEFMDSEFSKKINKYQDTLMNKGRI